MDEILESIVHRDNKSTYNFELRRALNNELYIIMDQNIDSGLYETKKTIKFRPSSLSVVIQVLTNLQKKIPQYEILKKSRFNFKNKQELINRYLNNVLEIETLAVQFDISVEEIEQLLRDEKIVITSNKIPKEKPRRFWSRKKKSGK